MMGILLFIVAALLLYILSIPFILVAVVKLKSFKAISEYFFNIAFAIDQLGNVFGAPTFNWLLIKPEAPKKYGNPDETISHVTGVNYNAKKLRPLGKLLSWVLNIIDPGHVQKAAGTNQDNK